MTTTPTPEQFLAQTEPDEDDDLEQAPSYVEPSPFDWPNGPLEAIAESLLVLVARVAAPAVKETEVCSTCTQLQTKVADLEAEVTEIEALHDAKQALIEQVLAVCKPSVGKLAIAVRAVLEPVVSPPAKGPQCPACERYFADQELLDRHACTAAPSEPPAQDAPIEDWVSYARSVLGPDSDADLGRMNRSQIRTLLGIPQTEA